MTKSNDIVQRLATGKLTEAERKGYSEENSKYGTENQILEPKKISFGLQKEERIAIYQDIKDRVMNGATPDDIGKAVVACIEEILAEKEKEAYGGGKPPAKGGFSRVE